MSNKKDKIEKESELSLPAYDSAFFWKIDWKSLPADFAFIAFGIILSQGYFSNQYFFDAVSPQKILGLFLVVVVSVCWYMGFILSRYNIYYNNVINKLAKWIFSIAGITLLGYLFAALGPLMENNANKQGGTFAMFSVFFLVLGPFFGIGGWMTGNRIVKAEANRTKVEEEKNDDEMFYGVMFGLILGIGFLVGMSQTDFVQQSSISFVWIILIFIGSGFVTALGIGMLMLLKKALVKIGLFYRIAFILETAFPMIIISSLIFWNEMQKYYLSGLSPTGFLGVLFFTGILPFRMLLVFNPPLRVLNLFIGIASFVFYIWSVY